MTAEQDGLDPSTLAEIREDDARLVAQLPPRPVPPRLELAHVEHPQTTLVRLSVDRRALLAEVDRLAALALDLQGKVARVEAEARWLASGPTANIDTLTRAVAAARISAALADPQKGTHADN